MIVAKTLTVAHRIQKALELAAVTRSTDVRMLNEVGSKGTCSEMHIEVHCSFVCKELQSTQLNSNSNTNPGLVQLGLELGIGAGAFIGSGGRGGMDHGPMDCRDKTQNRLNLEPTTRPTNSIVTATRKCRSRTSLISLKAYAIAPTAQ